MNKYEMLLQKLKSIDSCFLMFSGGLDSCAILGTAVKAGIDITPIWVNNSFGRATREMIVKQAENLGSKNIKVVDIQPNELVYKNPKDRCYYCKNQIISAIKSLSNNTIVLDGSTSSDTGYRPGLKALREQGVISPLAELGISSDEAKAIAVELGADKNIADLESCMATRVNYLTPLKKEYVTVLKDIENTIIQQTGDFNVRCRLDDEDHIRIELSAQDSFNAFTDLNFKNKILEKGESVVLFTTLDLKPSRPNSYDNRILQ